MMVRRAIVLVTWICAGHAVAALLFLSLINVPDSNAPMLLLSALLIVSIVVVVAITDGAAVAWLQPAAPRRAVTQAFRRGVVALVCGAAFYALLAWIAWRAGGWHSGHAGELDAWWIATFDSARTAWLHRTIRGALFALRDIVGVSLALALFCSILLYGFQTAISMRWLRAGLSRIQLGTVALAMVVLVVLPWRLVAWRPAQLPSTWIEPAFVSVKLVITYLIIQIGWTLMLIVATRSVRPPVKHEWVG
jgi:hypothetical protein